MHIAILRENEEIVDFIGKNFKQTLKIGDNVSSFRGNFRINKLNSRPYIGYFGRRRLHKDKCHLLPLSLLCPKSDQLERTPLHYAMGVNGVEAISRILVKNGAKRVAKDLKGRQPSYYFMNKADILRLQEEEEK